MLNISSIPILKMKCYKFYLVCFLYTVMMSKVSSQDGIFRDEPVKENPFFKAFSPNNTGQNFHVESGTAIDSHEHSKPNFFSLIEESSSVEESHKSKPCSQRHKRDPQKISSTVKPYATTLTPDTDIVKIQQIRNESSTAKPTQQTPSPNLNITSPSVDNKQSSLDSTPPPDTMTKIPRRLLSWLTRIPPAIMSTNKPFIFRRPTRRPTPSIRVSTTTVELLRDNSTTEESTTIN